MWLIGCSTALGEEGAGDHRSRLGDRVRLGDLAVAPGESEDLAERGDVARVGDLAKSGDRADLGEPERHDGLGEADTLAGV